MTIPSPSRTTTPILDQGHPREWRILAAVSLGVFLAPPFAPLTGRRLGESADALEGARHPGQRVAARAAAVNAP